MNRLGLRLATAGGRGALIALGLTALAIAIGTSILLFALAFKPALDSRSQQAAWRTNFSDTANPDDPTLLVVPVDDVYLGQPLVRVLVAPLKSGAPVPPGIPRLPGPGQAFVSPALATLLADAPPDELGGRFGTVVGTIGNEALRSPQELVAVVGSTKAALQDLSALPISAFSVNPPVPPVPPIAELMIVLAIIGALAPVAVFVSTATRLSAARREQRLAALRLVGATAAQVTRLAVIEAVVAATLGVVGGIVLFFVVRPLIALVPLDGATWFPDSIQPPLLPAIVMLLVIPMLAAVVAVASLRRVIVTPLGVQRRQRSRNPGFVRLAPLIASVAILVGAMTFLRAGASDSIGSLSVLGAAFAGIIIGIVLAGPWLTVLVGRGLLRLPGGAATLLASRRLTSDPFGSFGSIAGVIMAVFVASAFFTFLGYSQGQTVDRAGVLHPDDVFIEMPFNEGPSYAELPARLAAIPGVTGLLAVPSAEILVDGQPDTAWVVPCGEIAAQFELPADACGRAPIHLVDGTPPLATGSYQLAPDRGNRAGITLTVAPGDSTPLIVPGRTLGDRLPQLLIDPSLLAGAAEQPAPTRFYLRTDGSSATAERIRTAVALEVPTATVHRFGEPDSTSNVFEEFGRVVGLGLIGSLILAGCSLAVAVTIGVLERRRQFALLRSAGMPASRLRVLVMLQAGAPLIVVAAFSAVLGIAVTQLILRLADASDVPLPDASLGVVLGVSLLGALAVVAMMLPPLERLTRPESVRLE
jgi:hypothetical protein